MRVAVLLDPEVDCDLMLRRGGSLLQHFNHHVIDALNELGYRVEVFKFDYAIAPTIDSLLRFNPDVTFNLVTSGVFGDGRNAVVASILEMYRFSYTGAGLNAVIMAGNKALSKSILEKHGIPVPKFFVAPRGRNPKNIAFEYPIIVKPIRSGGAAHISSKSLVNDRAELVREVTKIHRNARQDAICEQFISGRDITVGMVETNDRIECLPPFEWHFPGARKGSPRFFTFKAKWDPDYRRRNGIVSSRPVLDRDLLSKINKVAVTAFRQLQLRDYSNVDLRVDSAGEPYFIEANANPGLWPDSGRFGSLPFSELIEGIVMNTHRRGRFLGRKISGTL